MKKFISEEALDLRHGLQVLSLYHALNILTDNIAPCMKLVDMYLMCLAIYSSLKLSKVHIVWYTISTAIMVFIGLSHLPFFGNFRSTFAYLYFASEMIMLATGTPVTLYLLY